MKFGDKLIALRKKNGLSQEDLAAKLNVSRQSVSKWESNNTYPETDKIVQICNIFDCSMDDLINDNITDLSSMERINKTNFNYVFDSLLEFITKTINMFASMKFSSGLKCLFEMFVIVIVISIGGVLVTELLSDILGGLVSFLPDVAYHVFLKITNGIFRLLWFILIIIVSVHVFKIRYLDYYDQILKKEKSEQHDNAEKTSAISTDKKSVESFSRKKDPEIIIRDPNQQPFAFLSVLSKFIILFVKFIAFLIGLGFAAMLVCFVVGFVLSFSLSKYSMIFVGVDLGLLGAIVIDIILLLFIFYFIFDKKSNVKLYIFICLGAVILSSIGIGVSFLEFKNIEFKNDVSDIAQHEMLETPLTYADNMVITNDYVHTYFYVVDDTMGPNEIVVSTEYDTRFSEVGYHILNEYGMKGYDFYFQNKVNFKDIYKIVTNDLKHNILRDYSFLYADFITIRASQDTISHLISNLSKVYLYDQNMTDQGIKISNLSSKIRLNFSGCDASYDAVSDTVKCLDDNCICSKQQLETSRGIIIQYSCEYDPDATLEDEFE